MSKWTCVPLGTRLVLFVEAEGDVLRRAWFAKREEDTPPGWRAEDRDDALPVLVEARRQLREYVAGRLRLFTVPFRLDGTAFQQQVWQQLTEIPCGEVRSYANVAQAIGRPKAVRAVGAANGSNPLPVFVPCHRVIGSDGSLTGFSAGLEVKRALLALEGAAVQQGLPLGEE
ncbi:methylated-DNA--[protein]-cysteine S-methyltransferase [Paludibaculum fermentans]|uniref:methylated-DNA--[protein]-cysteine S-methyltransferase n=1 Tax=Paludibaculum fermentans TaxID=1473598 RepID=UPI003EBD5CF5